MKPTKNRIFCPGCQKHKMLFDNESKAQNFLKYNTEEILADSMKAPVRSYYCQFCNGWHVTSNPSTIAGERLNVRDTDLAKRIRTSILNETALKALAERVSEKLSKFNVELVLCEFDEAEDILNLLEYETGDILENFAFHKKASHIQYRVKEARAKYEKHLSLYQLTKEEQQQYLKIAEPTKEEKQSIGIIKRQNSLKMVRAVFANRELLLESNDTQMVYDILSKCKVYIDASTPGNSVRGVKERLDAQLNEIVKQRMYRWKTEEISLKDEDEVLQAPSPASAEKKQFAEENAVTMKTLGDEALGSTEEKTPANKSMKNEEPQIPDPKFITDDYKANIIALIDKIQAMKNLIAQGDYDECEDILDVCYLILEDMGREDDNTNLIKAQLDSLKARLAEM